MSTADPGAAVRPSRLLPIRVARWAWRALPWIGFAAVLPSVAWVLGAPRWLMHQAWVAAAFAGAYAVLSATVTEILAPARPELRLVRLSDVRARRLNGALRALLFLVFAAELSAWLMRANGGNRAVVALLALARDMVLVATGAILVWSTGLFRRLRENERDTYLGLAGRVTGRFLFPLAVLAAFVLVVLRGLGYVPLARYVAAGVARTALQVVLAAIVWRYLYAALRNSLALGDSRAMAGAGAEAPSPETIGMERIGSGLLRLLVGGGALLWILAGWGLSPGTVLGALDRPVWDGGALRWGSVLGGLGRVALVLLLGGLARNVLLYFVFPRGRLDVGARYAILAVLRYAVVALAAVFGLEASGLSTDSLGWFLGAAGIGLGFGLQDVLGNFFSGLVMLLERPIRVGDVIQVGTDAGTVEAIRMRGTTIRTFDNMTVLIPNRQLLAERVTNMTYGMGYARVRIDVGVSYDADPERVRDLLLRAALAHPRILTEPPPAVTFQAYGESSLDFSLFCHTDDVRGRLGVASELRYEVLRRLRDAGVEIPYPQRDLHVRTPGPTPGT
jgi:potassium efflux system protein